MNKVIKYLKWILIGLIMGIITGYLRQYSSITFWSLSDIAGRFGFWILTVSLISYFSKNKKEAFINNLCYMIFMCISYYGYLYIFNDFLYIKQFILWSLFSILSSFYGILINNSKNNKYNKYIIILILPIVMLGIEMINMLNYFIRYKTNFLQLLIDSVGTLILIYVFQNNMTKKNKSKEDKEK